MKTVEYLAFVFIGAGILRLIGYLARAFFTDPALPIVVRVLAGIAAVGFVLLLGYLGWDRIQKARKEPTDIKEAKH
ncbi:MAG: hypothetical protein ACE5IE_06455 [Dehalococcoidia bacterium]